MKMKTSISRELIVIIAIAMSLKTLIVDIGSTLVFRAYVMDTMNGSADTSTAQGSVDFYVSHILIISIAITIVFVLAFYLIIKKKIVIPLEQLTKESQRFSEEKKLGDKIPCIDKKNEIGQLAQAIVTMEGQILDDVDELLKVTAKNERIETELGIAAKIQKYILPGTFPAFPDRKDFDIYAYMQPAREVGGDYYDFFLIDDNHLALTMADVSGKGISAAMFMMHAKSTIKSIALDSTNPKEIITQANKKLCENNNLMMFVTVWLGIVTLDTGHIDMVNAGHEDILMGNPDKGFDFVRVKHNGFLGIKKKLEFDVYSIDIEKGDYLFIYTDGVVEANDVKNQMYGADRLRQAAVEASLANCKDLIDTVKGDLEKFTESTEQFDDITMLCFKMN